MELTNIAYKWAQDEYETKENLIKDIKSTGVYEGNTDNKLLELHSVVDNNHLSQAEYDLFVQLIKNSK